MRKIVLAGGAGTAAVALAAGLAVWFGTGGSKHAAAPPRPTGADLALRDRLLPRPAGATPSPSPRAGSEELVTPSGYAKLFGPSLPTLPALRQYQCRRVAVRGWVQQNWPVRTDLLDFGTAQQAAGYLAARQQQYKDFASGEDGVVLPVPGLPGGQLSTDPVGDASGQTAVVLAAHDTVVMQFTAWRRNGYDLGTVADLARRQYARIDTAVPAPPVPARIHDGDLTSLLLPRPRGTEKWDNEPGKDGLATVQQVAQNYKDPQRIHDVLSYAGVDRVAVRTWAGDSGSVEIYLYHFASADAASGYAQRDYAEGRTNATPVLDGHFGHLIGYTDPDRNGDEQALAAAQQGNLVVEVDVWKPHQADTAAAHDLLTRQLARL